jgi:hypothetical protein
MFSSVHSEFILANVCSAVTQSPISHLRNIVLACRAGSSAQHVFMLTKVNQACLVPLVP